MVNDVDSAIDHGKQQAILSEASILYVVGGAEIYRLFLLEADCIILTEVQAELLGDAYFDLSVLDDWREVNRKDFSAGEYNSHDFSVIEFERLPKKVKSKESIETVI